MPRLDGFLLGNALADTVDQILSKKARNAPHGDCFQICQGVSLLNILSGTVNHSKPLDNQNRWDSFLL